MWKTFFLYMFLANQRLISHNFLLCAPHRGQPGAKCHPRRQPTRRLAISCGLGRCRIRTQDCRTTVKPATTEPPCLPLNGRLPLPHFSLLALVLALWVMILPLTCTFSFRKISHCGDLLHALILCPCLEDTFTFRTVLYVLMKNVYIYCALIFLQWGRYTEEWCYILHFS